MVCSFKIFLIIFKVEKEETVSNTGTTEFIDDEAQYKLNNKKEVIIRWFLLSIYAVSISWDLNKFLG